jgi:hypothetical protein
MRIKWEEGVTNWAQDRDGCLNNVTRKFGTKMKEGGWVEVRLAISVSARVVQSRMSVRENSVQPEICQQIFV